MLALTNPVDNLTPHSGWVTDPKYRRGTEDDRSLFTALHGMQTRSSDENSVCLSVCLSVRPSVTRVICDKTVERSVQIFIPYERTFILVF